MYSWLHFSLTMTDVPIKLFRKGLGLTAARLCAHKREREHSVRPVARKQQKQTQSKNLP